MSGRRAKAIRRAVVAKLGGVPGWQTKFRRVYRAAKRAWRASGG